MTIQLRRDTAANWASANPVLASGQPGYDTTNNELRIGDGVATWSALTAIGGGGGVSDHGALTGLADDDHTQYHNDTRGDARYYTKTLLDAGQLDTRYFTESEVTAGFQPLATVLTNTTAAFTTAQETKLSGIAAGAEVNVNADWNSVSGDSQILNKPATFTPSAHTHVLADVTNVTMTVANLNSLDDGVNSTLHFHDSDRARANHTGTQLSSTVSDFNTAADARVVAGITGKENSITAGTTAQYWRGDKSWQTLDKTAVGLGNVDNTSDTTKNAAAVTLTNKTISGASNTFSSIPESAVTNLVSDLSGKQPLATVLTNTTASYTTAEQTKLSGIATGATANSSDATLLSRANHTGTQTASTISDFSTAADARITAATGVSVQAYDADLASLAAASATNSLYYRSAANTWSPVTIGANITFSGGTLSATGGGGGGGSVTSGTSTVAFGATATNEAQLVVTGQTGILAGSRVTASIGTTATADYTEDDHKYLGVVGVHVTAGSIVAGTGFTIYVRSAHSLAGDISINWVY